MSKSNIGFYRNDGLGIFQNILKPETERNVKDIKVFKERGSSITIRGNLKTVDSPRVEIRLFCLTSPFWC